MNVDAELFDGRSPVPVPVTVRIEDDQLQVRGQFRDHHYALTSITWPEKTRAGSRILALPDGASLHSRADGAWQALASAAGIRQSRIVGWQQSARHIVLAVLLFAALGAAGYVWGLPWLARTVVTFIPQSIDARLGEQALGQLGDSLLTESRLSAREQTQVRQAWRQAVRRAWPAGDAPDYRLLIRKSQVGPNAFALPGGIIVLTDELVQLGDGDTDMVVGVLAHELGHVIGRHGMRQIVQASLLATLVGMVMGDVNTLATTLPLVLSNLAYTRALEREADIEAIRILQAARIDPAVMVSFFRKIETLSPADSDSSLGILFSTHPGSQERIERFQQASRGLSR